MAPENTTETGAEMPKVEAGNVASEISNTVEEVSPVKLPRGQSQTSMMISSIKKQHQPPKIDKKTVDEAKAAGDDAKEALEDTKKEVGDALKIKDPKKAVEAAKSTTKRASSVKASKASSAKNSGRVVEQIRSTPSNDSSDQVVRKTSFRKIRGFLRGASSRRLNKKDTKNSKTGEASAESQRSTKSTSNRSGDDDGSTVYNVTLDDRSVANSTVASDVGKAPEGGEKYLLRMVLLLMDVATRRFELLQLEFDSEKALVSDVLTQVPVSVTEETLRNQKYEGIVTADGEQMAPEKALADFCNGNDVLVAVPEGVSPAEASRLSKPILSDVKVVGMLKSSGVKPKQDAGEPAGEKKEEDDAVSWSSRQIPDYGKVDKKAVKLGGSLVFGGVVIALAVLVATFVHRFITTPIQPGHLVPPGIVLSKCGLKFFSGCERAYLEVESGAVSFYEGKELTWVIHGHSCPVEDVKDKTCVDGLEFKQDRTLWLGGEPIKWIEHYSDKAQKTKDVDYLTPWPFSEEPKVKSWEIASNKLKTGVGGMAGGTKKAASNIADGTKKAAANIADSTKKTAAGLADNTKKTAANLANNTKTTAANLADGTKKTAGKIKDEAADRIKKVADRVKETPMFMKK